jgi:hypothetical protein
MGKYYTFKTFNQMKVNILQYNVKTCRIFPKLAIVVRTGTRPFIVEKTITFRVSEKFATNKKMAIKIKLMNRLVFNDLASSLWICASP